MKLQREQLKSLIKECLVEILSEGLGNSLSVPVRSLPQVTGISETRARRPQQRRDDPILDRPVSAGRSISPSLKEAVRQESKGDPMLASILAHTAATTLPNMLSAERGGMGAPGGQEEQFNGTPEQVFGEETTSRWSSLAFMDAPKKSA